MRTLLMILVAISIPHWAQAGELERAVQLTDEMKYPQALKIVDKILRSPKSGPEDLATAFRVRGMCLAAMGKQTPAVTAFRQLLAIQPDFAMSKKVSPKLSMPFAQAQKASAGQKPIALTHQPPPAPASIAGAELAVDLVANPLGLVSKVRILYRAPKTGWQQKVWKVKKPRVLTLKVPKQFTDAEIQYYFEAHVRAGGVLTRVGSAKEPFVLKSSAAPAAVAAAPGDPDENPAPAPDGQAAPAAGTVVAAADAGDSKLTDAAADARLEDDGAAGLPADDGQEAVDDGGKKDGGGRWYTAWWFWTGVGVVVAGAVVGASVAATSSNPADKTLYQVHLQ